RDLTRRVILELVTELLTRFLSAPGRSQRSDLIRLCASYLTNRSRRHWGCLGTCKLSRQASPPKSLTEKYFTAKSLFLKDLAKTIAKYLIPKDRIRGGYPNSVNLCRNKSRGASLTSSIPKKNLKLPGSSVTGSVGNLVKW